MRFYFILFLISSLSALSSLPYGKLNTKLMDAKGKLEKLATLQALTPLQKNYIVECNTLNFRT